MGSKKENIKQKKEEDCYYTLQKRIKKVMELTAARNNSTGSLKVTVEETNNELRKTNENLTQLQ